MKKLKLNLQQFEGAEVLTRSQLKQILGGDDGSGGGCDQATCEAKGNGGQIQCTCVTAGQLKG